MASLQSPENGKEARRPRLSLGALGFEASSFRASGLGYPKGSKDPNYRASRPKYDNDDGIWDLMPYYLGPWTLRVNLRCFEDLKLLGLGFRVQGRTL